MAEAGPQQPSSSDSDFNQPAKPSGRWDSDGCPNVKFCDHLKRLRTEMREIDLKLNTAISEMDGANDHDSCELLKKDINPKNLFKDIDKIIDRVSELKQTIQKHIEMHVQQQLSEKEIQDVERKRYEQGKRDRHAYMQRDTDSIMLRGEDQSAEQKQEGSKKDSTDSGIGRLSEEQRGLPETILVERSVGSGDEYEAMDPIPCRREQDLPLPQQVQDLPMPQQEQGPELPQEASDRSLTDRYETKL